jgi:hypothetical protein
MGAWVDGMDGRTDGWMDGLNLVTIGPQSVQLRHSERYASKVYLVTTY